MDNSLNSKFKNKKKPSILILKVLCRVGLIMAFLCSFVVAAHFYPVASIITLQFLGLFIMILGLCLFYLLKGRDTI